MLNLGALTFAAPWILAALAVLPVLWWLLRATPPAPAVRAFPPVRLLLGLEQAEETPIRTPWWLILLRIVLAALVIVALADPVWNARTVPPGSGPLVIVVDDGWAAAPRWQDRTRTVDEALAAAEREGRAALVLPTAVAGGALTASLMPAGEARRSAAALMPKPWGVDRAAAAAALEAAGITGAEILWLADGIDHGNAFAFAERLARLGTVRVLSDAAEQTALALAPPSLSGEGFGLTVVRSAAGPERTVGVVALASDGRRLARTDVVLAAGAKRGEAGLALPSEIRNSVARLEIEGAGSAGAIQLLDSSARRARVGIAEASGTDGQPLLARDFYVARALEPFADVDEAEVTALLERRPGSVVLTDVGRLPDDQVRALDAFVRGGGVLVRFAGPRLAAQADDLVPVTIRTGTRALGGALAWATPQRLAPFPENSPFARLAVPEDVTVSRQVLAEPSVDLGERTWARLADGTPLVTAARRGEGWVVLFHVTSTPDWSTLPLSGLFVDMLRRTVALGSSGGPRFAGEASGLPLPPIATLDGFGRLGPPAPTAVPLAPDAFAGTAPGPANPPGLYGRGEETAALNLVRSDTTLAPLPALPAGTSVSAYAARDIVELKPWLFGAAVALLLADALIALALAGLLGRLTLRRAAAGAAMLLLVAGVFPGDALAAAPPPEVAASEVRLAYVLTGVPATDAMSRQGLESLSEAVAGRTAAEPAAPVGVDLARDELAFYPVLYWPMDSGQPDLSPQAVERVSAYLRGGGLVVFDTRDDGVVLPPGQPGPGEMTLRRLTAGLDLPPVEAMPADHVLTKAFYLLQEFPGRYAGGRVWVESPPREGAATNDGVSTVIVGGADWAAGWARDAAARPVVALAGGERQQEFALRFGVNLVMYALTGNYKADQVHVPALLERLGQ